MRHRTPSILGAWILGSWVCTQGLAQDSALDRALGAVRQTDGTANVEVEILQNDESGEYDCHGRNARVIGNSNNVSFRNCGTVSVPGNKNTVNVYNAELIKVYGTSNIIHWTGDKKPQTKVLGSANRVSQLSESQPPPKESGASAAGSRAIRPAIVIDQSTQLNYEMDCEGRDVQVQAGGVSVMLHGGCGAISVQGTMDQVTFDRARRLQVTGIRNTVRWAQRPTTVSNSGSDNSLGPQH